MDKQYNSSTIQVYYKGFSILLTERGEGKDMQELFQNAVQMADHALSNNCVPSWNPETNRVNGVKVAQPTQTAITEAHEPPAKMRMCPLHNAPMYEREGKFGAFYSHQTGEYQADGKVKWCNGYPKKRTTKTPDAADWEQF